MKRSPLLGSLLAAMFICAVLIKADGKASDPLRKNEKPLEAPYVYQPPVAALGLRG